MWTYFWVYLYDGSMQMAFNYYVFQRAAIIQNGLSRFTIGELSQVMRLFGLLVVCTFLILAVVSGVQFSQVSQA